MRSQISGIGRRRYGSMRCVRRYSGKRCEERQRSGRGDGWTTREGRGQKGTEGWAVGWGGRGTGERGRHSHIQQRTDGCQQCNLHRGQADPCFRQRQGRVARRGHARRDEEWDHLPAGIDASIAYRIVLCQNRRFIPKCIDICHTTATVLQSTSLSFISSSH